VYRVGDVMYDTALYFGGKAKSGITGALGLREKEYVLATVHRAENTDDTERLKAIFDGLIEVAGDMPVVLPLHPRTAKALGQASLAADVSELLNIIEPAGYLDMITLEKQAALIVTDSGGVQKEAYFHRVPCVTLRDETEWVELVEHGWNTVCSPVSGAAIAAAIRAALGSQGEELDLYGGGNAAETIVDILTGRL